MPESPPLPAPLDLQIGLDLVLEPFEDWSQ